MTISSLLKIVPENNYVLTQLAANSDELPQHIASEFSFEGDVNLTELSSDQFCLSHSTRLEHIFGPKKLALAFEDIQRGRFSTIEPSIQALLLDKGFVVTPGTDIHRHRRDLMKEEESRTAIEPSFTLLRILLTDICNLNCNYCKVIPNIDAPQKPPVSFERLEETIRFYFTYSKADRPKIIHISGGEPTIYFDRVREIVELTERLKRENENVWLVLGTNATLIDDERAAYLAKHDVKCIVSMDGPQEIHDTLRKNWAGKGSWELVDRGIRKLKAAGAEVSISMVIGGHTVDSVGNIIEWFMDQYQPTGMGVNFMKPPTPSQRNYEFLVDETLYADTMYQVHKQFRDRGLFLELIFRKLQPFVEQRYRFHDCGAAGGTNLNIDAKGNIGPCKSFLVMKKLAINELSASTYKDTVISAWRRRSPIYYEHCNKCEARGMCGNGCAYDAHVNGGNEMGIDVRSCGYTKQFNGLFVKDLHELTMNAARNSPDGIYVANKADRMRMLGDVRARPRTLSYSIGHQTMD